MKTLSLICLIAGLILAPAYWIYAKFYTGKQTAMLSLSKLETADPAGSLGAAKSATAAETKWRSAPFELKPEMAPVGLVLHARASFAPNMDESQPPQNHYFATLIKSGEAAKPLPFVLKASSVSNSNPVFKEHLLFFNVVKPGSYQIEISPTSEPKMAIQQMQLEIRQDLHEPNSQVVTAGIILIVLAILGWVVL